MKSDKTTFTMDKCIMLFILLLVQYSTMSQYYVIHLSSEEPIVNITSPNYPNDYDNDVEIIWEVIAPTGFRVMVQFTDFDLEESTPAGIYHDFLKIYHGLTNTFEDATERALLAGSSLPGNISSIGSYLWLQFTTDGSIMKTGFSLSVRAVETVIINLTSEETIVTIISPNYPNDYDNNLDVVWQVIAPTGFRVMIQFKDFKLWQGDSLSVYHGLTNSWKDATFRAYLSGSSLPANISSIGSYLWLWFTSDDIETETGFSLLVWAVEPAIINLTSGETIVTMTSPNYPNDYDNNLDIVWHVIAPTGFRVVVQFFDLNLEYGDFLTVVHGLTNSLEDASFRAFISGSLLRDNISSIGSYLWLWFTSDGSETERGFSLLVSAVEPVIINLKSEETIVTITSPNYPNDYDNNADIVWQVKAPTGFRVMIQFTKFDLEEGPDDTHYDSLEIYHGLTNSLEDATRRAHLSGSSLPGNISSIGSYVWLWFTTDGSVTLPGFSLLVSVVKPTNTETPSTPTHTSTNPSESTSLQVTLTDPNTSPTTRPTTPQTTSPTTSPTTSSTTAPTTSLTTSPTTSSTPSPTSPPTTLKKSTDNSLTNLGTDAEASTVTPVGTASNIAENVQGGPNSAVISAVCSVVVLIVIIMVIIAIFAYMRRRPRDPKVTEPVDQEDDDPNLYNNPVYCSKDDGLPIPDLIISTNSHIGSLSHAQRPSTYMDNQYEEFEGDHHPVTNVDGSASHHDALRDTTSESNTLNSTPNYTLEDPSNQGENIEALDEGDYHTYEQAHGPQSSNKPGKINKGQTGTDDVYQDLNNTSLSIDPYSSLASPKSGLPKIELQNRDKQGQSDGPAVLDDEEEYNALTFNQSSDIMRALKKPTSGGENVNNGYGVLDLPEQKDAKLFVNSPQLYNDDVYNTLKEGPQEQQNGKQHYTDPSSGYQALKLGKSNIPISHQGLNHNMESTDDGSTGGYESLSLGPQGPGPIAGSYERDQPGDESEYHSYQDPSEMNQDGSALTPTEEDVFSSDKYNILNSGKEVGDYHVYQVTDNTGVDEGNYEDLDAKMEDEYSEIDQSQNHAPGTTDKATFEPIYSDEVYSEFQ